MTNWLSYFDGLEEQRGFRVEAEHFVEQLASCALLLPTSRVLDFGCGYGYVSSALAGKVGNVFLWDGSASMRQRASATVAGLKNTSVLSAPPDSSILMASFDLILVNSVVQYMSEQELSGWLTSWRRLLRQEGQILIADIIPLEQQVQRDLLDQLLFSARKGFLLQGVKDGIVELRRYSMLRRARPLTRFSKMDVMRLADASGLTVQFLAANLTCRTARLSCVLRNAGNDANHRDAPPGGAGAFGDPPSGAR